MNTNSLPTSHEWLTRATALLQRHDIGTARLDALVLLEDATRKDRGWLLAHPEFRVPKASLPALDAKLERRMQHEPLAYIRGRSEFYGRTFILTPQVLVPRPETEQLIDSVKEVVQSNSAMHIADIGSGSGCIGITLALELPEATVDMYELDPAAAAVTRQNIQLHRVSAHCYQSDLLSNVHRQTYDILVANLPYVPTNYPVSRALQYEPAVALFAGSDGLDVYRQLWRQIAAMEVPPQFIFTESLPAQHQQHTTFAKAVGYHLQHTADFIQTFRYHQ